MIQAIYIYIYIRLYIYIYSYLARSRLCQDRLLLHVWCKIQTQKISIPMPDSVFEPHACIHFFRASCQNALQQLWYCGFSSSRCGLLVVHYVSSRSAVHHRSLLVCWDLGQPPPSNFARSLPINQLYLLSPTMHACT